MRRLRAPLAALALLLGAAPAATAAPAELTPIDRTAFPLREFVVTPDRAVDLDAGSARLTENGLPVADVRLEAVGQGRSSVLVLAIDSSESMRGAPIARAIVAARTLAARRLPGQRLAVVLFDSRRRVLLAPTTDDAKIARALSRLPSLGGGTLVHDAAARALELAQASGAASKAVVVLSDGDDTGSQATLADVGRRAKADGTRVFTVGLRSRKFEPTTLRELAQVGGGAFTAASSPAELTGIFEGLGARLAREYVLVYRSTTPPATKVDVVLEAPGLDEGARASYVVPGVAPGRPPAEGAGFWSGGGAVAVTIGLAALFVFWFVLRVARMAGSGRGAIRNRIAAFGMESPEAWVPEGAAPGAARAEPGPLERSAWFQRFARDVDVAALDRSPQQLALMGVAGGLLAAVLLMSIVGSPLPVVAAAAGPFVASAVVRRLAGKQRALFEQQLVDLLQGTASALRAGHTITSALAEVASGTAEPMRREMGRALADAQLGRPLDECLLQVADRMENRDVKQIALVAELQRTTGANMAEVLDRVAESVRGRMDLKRVVNALTAQGRAARGILSALPPGLLAMIMVVSPGYADPLFSTAIGITLLVVVALMTTAGSFAIKKIVEIEV